MDVGRPDDGLGLPLGSSCCSAASIPSPTAVPPRAWRPSSAFFAALWSSERGAATIAEELKLTRPTLALPGRSSMRLRAAARAASRRVGWTSVACIDPETSIASMTLTWMPGTRRVADGRAIASSSPDIPSRNRIGGRWRRTPGPAPATWRSRSRLVKRTA